MITKVVYKTPSLVILKQLSACAVGDKQTKSCTKINKKERFSRRFCLQSSSQTNNFRSKAIHCQENKKSKNIEES